jgi:2-octaprenyl-6-methoxyphenol hydroxylase
VNEAGRGAGSAAPAAGAPPRVEHCDVAIVGGGMVGASLALALGSLPLDVVVIEAVPPDADRQPSFDARTTALSNGTRRIFAGLGLWDELAREATPIRRIHVSDRGRFGATRLDAAEQGVPALGYVLDNRLLGAALWRRLAVLPRTRLWTPAEVGALAVEADHAVLSVRRGGAVGRGVAAGGSAHARADGAAGDQVLLHARLVVAADGAGSVVRREAGIEADRWDYGQTAIISNVVPERFHEHVAYERFTPSGPLALLPIADGRCVLVWTLAPAAAARVLVLDEPTFLAELQQCFGWRLGRFTKVGTRHAYPLALTRAEAQSAARVAIIGNAAQGLHPIAGQGFNLGLRDAATLAEVIAQELAGSEPDPGSEAVLARYANWRRADRHALIAFTDGLVRLFGSPFAPVRAARGLGLVLIDLSATAKTALARLSLGFAGRLPRLARGLSLVAAGAAVAQAPVVAGGAAHEASGGPSGAPAASRPAAVGRGAAAP